MPRKKNTGPLLFCEWVIGGPLPGARRALHPKPPKPKPAPPPPPPPRDVIRVEVTTDDEKEEDTLKITFPRSGKTTPSAAVAEQAEAVVKKVRFEDDKTNSGAAKKSAMKQPKGDDSDSSATLAESSSDGGGESSDASSSEDAKKKEEESESDGEPHPTCKCSRCVKRRKKAAKAKDSSSASESSEEDGAASSDTDEEKGAKQKEGKKKADKKQENNNQQGKKKDKNKGKKRDNSDADDEASESGKETTDEEEKIPAETKADKKKAAAEKKKQNNKAGAKDLSSPAASHDKKPSAPKDSSGFAAYPSAFPGPHARRPNLIGPIRAQVVQAEDVVETPEDPPPNAFYDAAANVMRVYYGPVYGNHHPQARSLYPRREAGRPLPVGVPHPTQNPYYYGFQYVPGYDQNGMPPAEGWNAAAQQMPGFPPFVVNPMFQQPQQQRQGQEAAAGGQYNKGAFSKNSPAAAPSVSQADDKAGSNNVIPTSKIDEKKTTSPYYTPSKTAAELRSNGNSHRNSPVKSPAAPVPDTANQGDSSTWDNNNNNNAPAQDTSTWGDGAGGNTTNNDTWNSNDGNAGNTTNEWPTDNNNDNNGGGGGGDSWDNNNNNNNNGGGDAWDAAAPTSEPPPADSSNVMPGSWDAIPTAPTPSWGNPNAAQSTNGAADTW